MPQFGSRARKCAQEITVMLKTNIGTLAVLFFLLGLAVAPVRAEMLLAEIGWNQPDPVTLPAGFLMRFVDPMTNNQASITTSLTSPDQTMAMTLEDQPSSMILFNRILARTSNSSRRVYITNDELPINQFGFNSFDGIWFPDFDPNDGYHAIAHVAPAIEHPMSAWDCTVIGLQA
jgi:hypothetical protein